ncbi:hypothetical protein MHYP_G00138690 [Metynnis hypsauchen]
MVRWNPIKALLVFSHFSYTQLRPHFSLAVFYIKGQCWSYKANVANQHYNFAEISTNISFSTHSDMTLTHSAANTTEDKGSARVGDR